jgi:hypothetical protein
LSSTNVGAESGASPSDVEKTAESYHSDALKKGERNDEWERGYGRRVRREWFPQHHDGTSGLLHPLSMDDLNRRRRHKARNPSTTPDHPGPSGPTSYVVVDNSFDSFVPSDEDTSDEKHKDEESRPSVDDVQSVYTSYFNSDSSSRRARRYHWKLARCADTMATHVWHSVCAFFDSRFPDIQAERAFKKEEWYANKNAALMASLFLLLQWILTVALQTTEGVWRKYVSGSYQRIIVKLTNSVLCRHMRLLHLASSPPGYVQRPSALQVDLRAMGRGSVLVLGCKFDANNGC